MTDAAYVVYALIWTFSCLLTFIAVCLAPHECTYRGCPHRPHEASHRKHK